MARRVLLIVAFIAVGFLIGDDICGLIVGSKITAGWTPFTWPLPN